MEGGYVTPLKRIEVKDGDVLHAMKRIDPGFNGFGEAYFSIIKSGLIKAWKRHRQMTLNFVVPVGAVRFVMFDDRKKSVGCFHEISISPDNYCRLTVPPMVWVGFQGLGKGMNLLLNIADIVHDPMESDRKNIDEIEFNWDRL